MMILENPDEKDLKYCRSELDKHINSLLPPENVRRIEYVMKEDDAVIAGISCNTTYTMLLVNYLWVDERYRKKGLGMQLLAKAEDKARSMGCVIASLGTFEKLNARGFYEKQGYEVVSTTDVEPPGVSGFWFHKNL